MEQAVLVSRHNSDERLSGMIIFSLLFLLEEWPNGDIIYELMALIRNKFFLIKLDFNIFVVYDVLIVNVKPVSHLNDNHILSHFSQGSFAYF